jgi:predicted metal-dependent enzyme (double-stranded beta helix superfamily)
MNTFSIEEFATECKAAMAKAGASSDDRQQAAKACLQQTLAQNDLQHIIDSLDAAIPADADIGEMMVHTSPELTMLYARVPARFQSGIHNHTVFACIGQLVGAEVNTIYEQTDKGIQIDRTQTVSAGEVISLPEDAIHYIENPNNETGYALHIYGGDFNAVMDERSLWDFDDLQETAFNFQGLLKESIKGMKQNRNQAGLDALLTAIPSAASLMNS